MRRRLTSKDLIMVGYKIKLYPTKEQKEVFNEYFGMSRFVYNLGLDLQKEHYKRYKEGLEKHSKLSFYTLCDKVRELKKTKYLWLYNFDSTSIERILQDVVNAYDKYLEGFSDHPTYHKKKFHHQMFFTRSDRLSIMEDTVRLPSIGIVSCDRHNHPEIIGDGNKDKKNEIYRHYYNSRVIFDGCNYWLSFSLEESYEEGIEIHSCKRFKNNEIWQHKETSEGIGIDLGIRREKWIVDSKGNRIERPNCSKEDRKIAKIQAQLDEKRFANDSIYLHRMQKQGKFVGMTLEEARELDEFNRPMTRNEEKLLNKWNKMSNHKTNRILAPVHDYACKVVDGKSEHVVMEGNDFRDMYISKDDTSVNTLRKKNHNKLVDDAMPGTVRSIIQTKCERNGIPFILADEQYPSTQLCNHCGNRHKIGESQVYRCPVCGLVIDRDLNASYNLRDYMNSIFYQELQELVVA